MMFKALCLLSFATGVYAAEVTPGPAPPPVVPETWWIGFAVSPNGRVFQSNRFESEALARALAAGECEHTSLHTCSAIAVVPEADVVAVKCGNKTFIGGSTQGKAEDIARGKALDAGLSGHQLCSVVFRY